MYFSTFKAEQQNTSWVGGRMLARELHSPNELTHRRTRKKYKILQVANCCTMYKCYPAAIKWFCSRRSAIHTDNENDDEKEKGCSTAAALSTTEWLRKKKKKCRERHSQVIVVSTILLLINGVNWPIVMDCRRRRCGGEALPKDTKPPPPTLMVTRMRDTPQQQNGIQWVLTGCKWKSELKERKMWNKKIHIRYLSANYLCRMNYSGRWRASSAPPKQPTDLSACRYSRLFSRSAIYY